MKQFDGSYNPGVQPDVTIQTFQLGSTDQDGMRQDSADGGFA